MTGTVIAGLTAAAQPDGTDINSVTGKGGWTSIQVGAGNASTFRDASRHGGIAGHQCVQAGAQVTHHFKDYTNTDPVSAFRVPITVPTAPVNLVNFLRIFPDATHPTATSLSLAMGTDRKIQLLEAGSTLRGTAAVALPTATELMLMILLSGTTGAITARLFPRPTDTDDGRTMLAEVTGTLAAPFTAQSIRWGIGNASSLGRIDTNDMFAVGRGDWLDRPDLVTLTATPTSGATDTVSMVVSGGGTDPAKTWRLTRNGAAYASSNSNGGSFSVPAADAGPAAVSFVPYVDTNS